jgi:hypothetical protein
MTKRDLDDAIDRAVRDIMSAEPRPGFRHRVLDRITARKGSGFRIGWLPALAGGGAGILIAIVMAPRGHDVTTQPAATTQSSAVTAPSIAAPPKASTERPAAGKPRRSAAPILRAAAPGMVQATSIEQAETADDVLLEPLNRLAPLAVTRMDEPRLATRDISIGELSITPIAVEPLPHAGGGK